MQGGSVEEKSRSKGFALTDLSFNEIRCRLDGYRMFMLA